MFCFKKSKKKEGPVKAEESVKEEKQLERAPSQMLTHIWNQYIDMLEIDEDQKDNLKTAMKNYSVHKKDSSIGPLDLFEILKQESGKEQVCKDMVFYYYTFHMHGHKYLDNVAKGLYELVRDNKVTQDQFFSLVDFIQNESNMPTNENGDKKKDFELKKLSDFNLASNLLEYVIDILMENSFGLYESSFLDALGAVIPDGDVQ